MNHPLHYAALMLALVGAAGCAASHARSSSTSGASGGLPGRQQCVEILYIQNWDVIDPNTLIVYAPEPKDAFLVKVVEPVSNLSARDSIGFSSGTHDGKLCGVEGDVMVRESLHDPVSAVRSLRGGEVRQLKASAARRVATPAAAAPAASTTPAASAAPAAPATATAAAPAGAAQPGSH
jgi:Family of unknown function (DUF6491)